MNKYLKIPSGRRAILKRGKDGTGAPRAKKERKAAGRRELGQQAGLSGDGQASGGHGRWPGPQGGCSPGAGMAVGQCPHTAVCYPGLEIPLATVGNTELLEDGDRSPAANPFEGS